MNNKVRNELCRIANITATGTVAPAVLHVLSLLSAAVHAQKTAQVNSYLHCAVVLASNWSSVRRIKFLVAVIGFTTKHLSIATWAISEIDAAEWKTIHGQIVDKTNVNIIPVDELVFSDTLSTLVTVCSASPNICNWAYKGYFAKVLDNENKEDRTGMDTSRQVAQLLASETKNTRMLEILNKEPMRNSN